MLVRGNYGIESLLRRVVPLGRGYWLAATLEPMPFAMCGTIVLCSTSDLLFYGVDTH